MNKFKKSQFVRRKQERQETREILENFADTLGMVIVEASGVRPENLEAAVLLLLDARDKLPVEPLAVIISSNPIERIEFVLGNVPTCPDCGSPMSLARDCA